MKRIVGVMPLWDDEKDSIWMLPGYMEGVLQAGGIPVNSKRARLRLSAAIWRSP